MCMVRLFTILSILFTSLGLVANDNTPESLYVDCPNDVWLNCGDEIWDLSIYGEPHVTSTHPYTVEGPVIQNHLNDCGAGHILRSWTIHDHYGNTRYCSQQIKLRPGSSNVQIHWPDDYTTDVCGASLEPSDLPSGYDYPSIYDQGDCSSIIMDYTDQSYTLHGSACKKILRTWTVADWCVYHPRDNPYEGIWEYIQIIKIRTNSAPEISCPADITASSGADCNRGYVNIPLATASSDCAQNIHITNNSPYASGHGADASGYYPLGETWVEFSASDGCGHETTCKVKVIVRDEIKPSPYCRHGLVTTLGLNSDGYYADVWPDRFDLGSYDNCTASENLKFEITPSHFTCDDLGRNKVFFTVTDESGNKNTCETYVIIQDNMGMCPESAHEPLVITGKVESPANAPLENVKVVINNSSSMIHMTDDEGHYEFEDMMRGENYSVRPIKNDDLLNGVTSMDMIIMLKHILGIDVITNPYQLIAADVDHSGDISVIDLFKLRNVLLGVDNEFPNNYSWRFMDANYQFINIDNPLVEQIPQNYYIQDYDNPMNDLNFMGIKIGDLNGSTSRGIQQRSNKEVNVNIDLLSFEENENIGIPFNIKSIDAIEGFQFTIRYDANVLEFINVEQPEIDKENAKVYANEIERGVIRLQYLGELENSDNQVDWRLNFKSSYSGTTSGVFEMDNEDLSPEAYMDNGQAAKIVLFENQLIGEDISKMDFKVYPNPVQDKVEMKFFAETEEGVDIHFYDVNGKLLMNKTRATIKGVNRIELNIDLLKDYEGVLIYRAIYDDQVISGQLIKM